MTKKVNLTRRNFLQAAGVVAVGAVCAAGGASLVGCSASTSSKEADLQAAYEKGSSDVVEFVDSAGRTVYLPKDIKSFAPSGSYAQILLATIAPERFVGLSSTFSKSQLKYLPENMADLPKLGRYYGKNGDMNYEEIIKINPDVIIDIGERKEDIEYDMDGLMQQTGLPVIFVQATIDQFSQAYRTLGELLGVQERAEEIATYIDEVFAYADERYDEIASRNLRTIYSSGEMGYSVKEAGSVHSAALERTGINNIAVLDGANSTEVSAEQMMIWAPDYLLLSPSDGAFDFIFEDSVWASIPAVENGHVYEVPSGPYEWLDSPPSVQTTLGVLWVGNLLAPDLYDFDMVEEAQEFYKLFWQYDLSVEEAQKMLANSTLK
jgi:iron complex transport system substrate-binding protein